MKPFNFLLPLLLLLSSTLYGENRQKSVDSLQSILKTCSPDTNKVNILINLSNELYEMDAYPEALAYATDANRLSEALGFKTGLAGSYRRMGAIKTEQGKYPEAIELLLKSMRIYESLKNSYGIFQTNNNLGTVYYNKHDNNKALEYYQKAYSFNNNDGLTCSNLAMIYIQTDYGLALNFFKRALNNFESSLDTNNIATTLNNIGAVYEAEKNNDSALVYYFKALKIKEYTQDNRGMCDVIGSIGDVYFKLKLYDKSIFYEKKSLAISKSIGYLNGITLTELSLSNIYTELNQCEKALAHFREYTIAKDQMFNEENTKKTVIAEKDFEFQKREELARAEQDKKDMITIQTKERQRIIIYSISGGLFLMLLLALFIFRGYKQKQKANIDLEEKNKIILEKKKEITDNINYAKRIQDAVMTPISQIQAYLPNSFSLNKPRDIVSGDFLFVEKINNGMIVAVADCTSHSVSGAMMTLLCHNLLSDAIALGMYNPADILNYVNTAISKKFHQTDDYTKHESDIVKDGMDIALINIDFEDMKYQFSGAYNPLLIARENQLIEIKADKLQMGQTKLLYKNNDGELQSGDMLYLSSDGYADQFSSDGKKFMKKRFKEFLLHISKESTNDQKQLLDKTIESWKGEDEQTDDILIMGIKI